MLEKLAFIASFVILVASAIACIGGILIMFYFLHILALPPHPDNLPEGMTAEKVKEAMSYIASYARRSVALSLLGGVIVLLFHLFHWWNII